MRPSPSTYLPSGPPPPPPPVVAAQPMHSPTANLAAAAEHHFHNDHCVMAVAAAEALPSKNCCGVHVTQTVSIRWFIVMIAFVGICCSIVGTALGALKASGREHLTVSLLMIGEFYTHTHTHTHILDFHEFMFHSVELKSVNEKRYILQPQNHKKALNLKCLK